LLFDEVITGFRLAYGGAQTHYGVTPDLTVLGKVMGGGFPCAAFGGSREVMEQLAPAGPVYQAGTLSGNPVAVAAGIAALDLAKELDPYAELAETADRLTTELGTTLERNGVPTTINRAESMFSVVLHRRPGPQLRGREGGRPRAVRRFFPPHARQGRVPAALRLRAVDARHRTREAEITAILYAATSFTG
jgi:glutamate-1-semialdehyde 2,1-aminomutase